MDEHREHQHEPEVSSSDLDDSGESGPELGNISGFLYLAAFAMLVVPISYGLTFVWPSDDKSLVYLPRFLTSCVLAFLIAHSLGLRPRS
jgi:hypothetical protein